MADPIAATTTNTTPGSVATAKTTRKAGPWTVSDKLLPFLGTWENGVANGKNFANQEVTDGFILKVYKDSRELPTVGCGHLVVDADKLKVGDDITLEKAKQLLKLDLATAEKAVNDKVNVPLEQWEYDALASIAFNTGRQGFIKLSETVNMGDYSKVPDVIKKYRTGGGNERRRASEAGIFETGTYDASH
jgi:lysozyme